ncbi:MAG TPA: hypothetical protein VGK20_01315 [Candidatus Binatia bacterium]|jgi:hypothetical protein
MNISKVSIFGRGSAGGLVAGTLAAVLAGTIGWSGQAFALNCMGDVAGNTGLQCTANDLGVASVTVTNVISNNCTGAGGTFTFDGTLNVDANSTTRYDLGFYIGADSTQALTGTCSVFDVPTNLDVPTAGAEQIDSDNCGDKPKNQALAVPVNNVTVTCRDADGNGFFDLAICASYDNNAQVNCSTNADLIPGTGSKCQCAQIPTNLAAPRCVTNADCSTNADDGNPCTDEVCHPAVGSGGDLFGCSHDPNTAPCDDGIFCNGTDICASGSCGHSGDPCTNGGTCANVCNEAADNCFVTGGTLCRASAGVCDTAETCTGTSAGCPADQFLSSVCRPALGVCDVAESCTGTSANCPGDSVAGSSVVCRASAGECDVAEHCTGASGSCPADGFAPSSQTCTPDTNVCTDDHCDGSGACIHPDNTASCNDGLFCTINDVCAGGECHGTTRDCSDPIACTDDSCDEAGQQCVHTENNANCDDQNACTDDVCSIADGGCVSTFICTQDICRSPGFWATHSGFEHTGSTNIGQTIIDLNGPFSVCGETISATSNASSPFLEGLGLTSDLEGLCMRTKGVHQRQLYRQLVAAELNCAISGHPTDCDAVVLKYITDKFSDCSALCAGTPVQNGPTLGDCVSQLDCFNNGGHIVDGGCATGTCEVNTDTNCGGDLGSCPSLPQACTQGGTCEVDTQTACDINTPCPNVPQTCVPFEGNCHAAEMCNEGIGFCPKNTPASSPHACQEARFDDCTIDSCP